MGMGMGMGDLKERGGVLIYCVETGWQTSIADMRRKPYNDETVLISRLLVTPIERAFSKSIFRRYRD